MEMPILGESIRKKVVVAPVQEMIAYGGAVHVLRAGRDFLYVVHKI